MNDDYPAPACASLLGLVVILCCNILGTAVIITHTFVFEPSPTADFKAAGIVFGATLFFYGALSLLKREIGLYHERHGTDEVSKCKLSLLIAFGGQLASLIIFRISFYYLEYNPYTFATIAFSHFAFSIILNAKFLYGQNKIIEYLDYSKSIPHTIISSIAHLILMVISIKMTSAFTENNVDYCVHMGTIQIMYSMPCATSTSDILTLLWGGVKIRNERMDEAHPQSKETSDTSFSDVTMYFYTALTILSVISFIIFALFKPQNPDLFLMTATLVGSSLAAILVRMALQKSVSNFFKKFQTQKLDQCQIKLIVGLGGCSLCSLVARVSVFFVVQNVPILVSLQFVPLFASCVLYFQFICGFRKTHNLDYINNLPLIWTVIGSNVLTFLVSCRIARYTGDFLEQEIIMLCQFIFCFLTAVSSIDLAVVLNGGLYTRKEVQADVNLGVVQTVQKVKKVEKVQMPPKPIPRVLCPICKSELSETKTPRILKECGHTVCEDCADEQLQRRKFICCPTCYNITMPKGSANLLVKNYAALDIIQDIQDAKK